MLWDGGALNCSCIASSCCTYEEPAQITLLLTALGNRKLWWYIFAYASRWQLFKTNSATYSHRGSATKPWILESDKSQKLVSSRDLDSPRADDLGSAPWSEFSSSKTRAACSNKSIPGDSIPSGSEPTPSETLPENGLSAAIKEQWRKRLGFCVGADRVRL